MFQLTVWSLPALATTFLSALAFRRLSKKTDVPGVAALRFLFAAVLFWSAGQTLGTLVVSLEAKILIAKLNYLGICMVPVAWTVFALTYTQRVARLSQRALNAISVIPIVTVILVFTNELHQLMWSNWYLENAKGYIGLVTEYGFWFYVNAVYSYALIIVSTGILTFALAQAKQHANTMVATIGAPICVGFANLFYLSPAYPFPWFDVTTLGFVLGIVLLERGVLHGGFMETAPIIRERIVEFLKDPVLVVSSNGMVMDVNQSALSTWPRPKGLLYSNIADLIQNIPLSTLRDGKGNTEVTIEAQAFEIASTSLDQANPDANVALVFRDVTARRQADRQLRNLKDELERMAHTDSLTNMFNRRFFMQRLSEEFERVRRHGSVLSVLIFDLDHFKQVNDTYGHDVGDAVLVAVSEVVSEYKRITDVACRLGGEEFALLLPETGRQGAVNLANRIRQGVADYDYNASVSQQLSVTVSIGVATVSKRTAAPEAILKVADRALYKAKNGGRNMVCVDTELA